MSKHTALPIIYDTDMDFDDAIALAYLCAAHRHGTIDLRAVTVVNNGLGVPRRALTHARSILARCGADDVPVAEGGDLAVNRTPESARAEVEDVLTNALSNSGVPYEPKRLTASGLIEKTLRESETPVAVLATGPLTNIQSVLSQISNDDIDERVERVVVMGGAFDVPGNIFRSARTRFDNSQEVNFWIDPIAAGDVIDRLPFDKLSIVPLDATNRVPITEKFTEKLANKRESAELGVVNLILAQNSLRKLIRQEEVYWWDGLAAVSLVTSSSVEFSQKDIRVVRSGVSAGALVDCRSSDGGHWIGLDANLDLFEELFLECLVN